MAWNGICGRERGGKVRGVSDGKKLAHSLTRKRQRWQPPQGSRRAAAGRRRRATAGRRRRATAGRRRRAAAGRA